MQQQGSDQQLYYKQNKFHASLGTAKDKKRIIMSLRVAKRAMKEEKKHGTP